MSTVNTPSFLTRGRTLVKLHVHTFYSVAGFSRFLISQAGSAGYREPPTSGTSLGGSRWPDPAVFRYFPHLNVSLCLPVVGDQADWDVLPLDVGGGAGHLEVLRLVGRQLEPLELQLDRDTCPDRGNRLHGGHPLALRHVVEALHEVHLQVPRVVHNLPCQRLGVVDV